VPVSKYGHLPTPPVDFCDDCGFKSQESFSSINFRHQRDYKLDSYKLDSVAEYFIKEKISEIITLDNNNYKLVTKNLVKEGNYIRIEENGESMDEKFIVTEVFDDGFIITTK
jgi:hypothetical protein